MWCVYIYIYVHLTCYVCCGVDGVVLLLHSVQKRKRNTHTFGHAYIFKYVALFFVWLHLGGWNRVASICVTLFCKDKLPPTTICRKKKDVKHSALSSVVQLFLLSGSKQCLAGWYPNVSEVSLGTTGLQQWGFLGMGDPQLRIGFNTWHWSFWVGWFGDLWGTTPETAETSWNVAIFVGLTWGLRMMWWIL